MRRKAGGSAAARARRGVYPLPGNAGEIGDQVHGVAQA
jgi:hypothetical protein